MYPFKYHPPGIRQAYFPTPEITACANVEYFQAMLYGMISKPPQALNKHTSHIKQTDL